MVNIQLILLVFPDALERQHHDNDIRKLFMNLYLDVSQACLSARDSS